MDEKDLGRLELGEVVEILVRHFGIAEGLWGLRVEFGIGAANLADQEGKTRPVALVPLVSLGLQRFAVPNNMTIDAGALAVVAPGHMGAGQARKKRPRPTGSRKRSREAKE